MTPPPLRETVAPPVSLNGQAAKPLELDEPVVISADQNDYSNGELEDAENQVGGNLNALLKPNEMPPHRYWMALVWVTLRRTRPEVTWEQVRAMSAADWRIGEKPGPLSSADAPNGSPSSPPSAPSTG